jgi:hypothetical protein
MSATLPRDFEIVNGVLHPAPAGHVDRMDLMEERRRPGPDHPETKRFLANVRRAAEAESDIARAREWRNRTPEEHGRVLGELLDLADAIIKGRGRPGRKEPLPPNPFRAAYERRAREHP